jgi:hypothetical protein
MPHLSHILDLINLIILQIVKFFIVYFSPSTITSVSLISVLFPARRSEHVVAFRRCGCCIVISSRCSCRLYLIQLVGGKQGKGVGERSITASELVGDLRLPPPTLQPTSESIGRVPPVSCLIGRSIAFGVAVGTALANERDTSGGNYTQWALRQPARLVLLE